MSPWQILLASYLVLGLMVAMAIFRLRHAYSPNRTEVLPSVITSLFTGMAWGILVPIVLVKRLRK